MAEALRKRRLAQKLTWTAVILSLGGLAVALAAAVGTGQEAWHYRTGLSVLRYAWFASLAGGLVALVALLTVRRSRFHGFTRLNLLALAVALAFGLYLGNMVRTARAVPAIHDVATNVEDVPKFYRLRVRDDNMANVPDLGRPELARMPPRERWQAVHREAYGDLKSIRVPWSVAETIERAERLARERGWEIVTADRGMGIMEAVETSLFFRFKDNVLVRARPVSDGGGSIVDMRSISRVGASDVGVNAKRVRAFLRDLQES
ncbi:MAG TPA: DUF1499 domain-containing protein [Allosphingosinicella sp.]|nr:DUF1499 domain-containing protein [Allosphingosinicella sp.]